MTPGRCSSGPGTWAFRPRFHIPPNIPPGPSHAPGLFFPKLSAPWQTLGRGGGGRCERHTALQARRQSLRVSTEGFHNKNPFTCAFIPTPYFPKYISYVDCITCYILLFHRRSLTDLLLTKQLRILFNPGACKVSSRRYIPGGKGLLRTLRSISSVWTGGESDSGRHPALLLKPRTNKIVVYKASGTRGKEKKSLHRSNKRSYFQYAVRSTQYAEVDQSNDLLRIPRTAY